MAKLDRDRLQDWLAATQQPIAIEAWIITATPITSNPFAPADEAPYDVERQLPKLNLGGSTRVHGRAQNAIVLGDGRLIGIGMGGLMRPAPKEIAFDVDAAEISVGWFDNTESGNTFRNWVIDLGDGRYYASATGIKLLGRQTRMSGLADQFVGALAERAAPIGPDDVSG